MDFKKTILTGLGVLFASAQASAMDCWKVEGFTDYQGWGEVAVLSPQNCTVTPEGYEWLINVFDVERLGEETHFAVKPEHFLFGDNTVFRILDSVDGVPLLMPDLIVGMPGGSDTTAEPPAQANTYWTSWLNRDYPSGNADAEIRSGFPASAVCDFPLSIEARIIGQSQIYTPENRMAEIMLHFDPQIGLQCNNRDQVDGRCENYQVRFECSNDTWGPWLDRDNPSGTGDWENTSGFGSQVCDDPIAIRARLKGENRIYVPGYRMPAETLAHFSPSVGLICRNSDQADDGYCDDYEVKFLCPTN